MTEAGVSIGSPTVAHLAERIDRMVRCSLRNGLRHRPGGARLAGSGLPGQAAIRSKG